MVGATGFEPATTCPPCKCATRLRYAPTEPFGPRRVSGPNLARRVSPEAYRNARAGRAPGRPGAEPAQHAARGQSSGFFPVQRLTEPTRGEVLRRGTAERARRLPCGCGMPGGEVARIRTGRGGGGLEVPRRTACSGPLEVDPGGDTAFRVPAVRRPCRPSPSRPCRRGRSSADTAPRRVRVVGSMRRGSLS